jgi:hypothetical protein
MASRRAAVWIDIHLYRSAARFFPKKPGYTTDTGWQVGASA